MKKVLLSLLMGQTLLAADPYLTSYESILVSDAIDSQCNDIFCDKDYYFATKNLLCEETSCKLSLKIHSSTEKKKFKEKTLHALLNLSAKTKHTQVEYEEFYSFEDYDRAKDSYFQNNMLVVNCTFFSLAANEKVAFEEKKQNVLKLVLNECLPTFEKYIGLEIKKELQANENDY